MTYTQSNRSDLFMLQHKTAVITGGSGALGSAMARALAEAGGRVAVLNRRPESSGRVVDEIRAAGGEAIALSCDVLDRAALDRAYARVLDAFGSVDILINAAGGNQPRATVSPETSFFTLDPQAVRHVVDLNFLGTFQSCQVFGRGMAEAGSGVIVNIASMAALRPLTRVVAYSAAKAAVVNFTQWLAVYLAQEYGPALRVNALAPGFFLTQQNRYLLTEPESGQWTARGETIVAHTPAGRLGQPEDLVGTLLWLVSPAAAFVTGTVIPVDGGFAAFGGV